MINFKKSKEEIILFTNLNGVPIQNLTELGNEYLKMQDLIEKYKQAFKEVEKYCNECNLKADYTACEVLKIINEVLND